MKQKKFKSGQVVVWDPKNFNKEHWDNLSEAYRLKYYSWAGYGQSKRKLFVFLCPILDEEGNDSGHCVLVDMDDQHIETMRHTSEFRMVKENEI